MSFDNIYELILCVLTALFMFFTILRQDSLKKILDIQYEMLKNDDERLRLMNDRIDLTNKSVRELEKYNELKL